MQAKLPRLRYQCRRGMLELDAILQPFFEQHFLNLTADEQQIFEQLLTCSDQELYHWFIGSLTPTNNDLQRIVNKIKNLTCG